MNGMKQGFLLKHLDMTEYNMEKALIDKVVECKSWLKQFSGPATASKTSTKTRSRSDTFGLNQLWLFHSERII